MVDSNNIMTLQWRVEQFLYREARLLDERRLDEWLDLWTMGCRYYVPVRHNKVAPVGEGLLPIEDELTTEQETAWIDDDKMMLFARVMRLRTGKAWSENPLSRTRRIISNVEVKQTESENQLSVISNSLQFRSRRQTEENWFSCQRCDTLLVEQESFVIQSRKVILDSAVLNAKHITLL